MVDSVGRSKCAYVHLRRITPALADSLIRGGLVQMTQDSTPSRLERYRISELGMAELLKKEPR